MYLLRSTEPRGKQLENKGMRGGKCKCIPEGGEDKAGDAFWPVILMLSLGLKIGVVGRRDAPPIVYIPRNSVENKKLKLRQQIRLDVIAF